ncbi:uncharacterized protein LOC133832569 [Humulus lupulus]|uniref:uncharacterized protein LOC133832569 n=1 Tax=Humulus lupulus TaxID=3486 RepID=UPI002B408D44|nr:uncharacterized protein LOC133832569 [Humulus lupulus]
MTDIEKSIKELVTKNNLRVVGRLAPRQDVRESTPGSTTGGGVPEQHQDVSQPPMRRTTGVTIREPSSTPQAVVAPASPGKGKEKVSEHSEPIVESTDENVMSAEDLFNLYSEPEPAAPPSKKKGSRKHRGESSSNPLTKKFWTADPPMPAPSKETTPPPAPIDQTSPPTPVDQTHPLAPVNQPPPASGDQTPPDQTGEALANIVLSSTKDRLTKLLRQRRSREAIIGTESMEVDQVINCTLNEVLSGVQTMSASWCRLGALTGQYENRLSEQLKASEDRHAEDLKSSEARHAEELKMVEAKYTEQLEAAEKKNAELLEQKAKLAEELKQHQATLIKAIKTKEKYKEASLLNFKEASKIQDDLVISRKETERCLTHLEEEKQVRVPASPEISLATNIDGVDEEIGASIDQQTPQDPTVS